MCGQINSWPHPTIKKALSTLYGFASEYPGIRHAGNPQSALREMEMRDLVAVLIVLTGFSPYLRDGFDANAVYIGSRSLPLCALTDMRPYQPPFQLTHRMTALVADIAERLGAWKAANPGALLPELRRGNRIRTLQASLVIEQNTLSVETVTAVLAGKRAEERRVGNGCVRTVRDRGEPL